MAIVIAIGSAQVEASSIFLFVTEDIFRPSSETAREGITILFFNILNILTLN